MSPPPDVKARASRMLCIGHSHAETVMDGAATLGVELEVVNLWDEDEGTSPVAKYDDGSQSFTPAVAARIRSHAGPVFSFIGGNAHVVLGTLRHPRAFDFVLPSDPGLPLDPDAEVLPSLAVRRLIELLVKPWIGLLGELAELADGPVFHMEPPPPSEGSKRMKPTLPWWLFPGMVHEITPAALRYKLWRLHSEIIEEACRPLGIEFVPVPPAGRSPRGYLRGKYFEDGFHGNTEYGRMLFEHMLEMV